MVEHRIDTRSNDENAHDDDCAFVCALLKEYPCAALEAYKNAPASIQADIDVAQAYLESRQAHRPSIHLVDHEKTRIAAGNTFSPESEARLAQLLIRFEYYTDLALTPEAALAMMRTERSEAFRKEIRPAELPVFD